jgi:hypothetical protein
MLKPPRTLLALLATSLAAIAVPAAAAAEEAIVPPGNSAATQYTQAFPTPGGEKESNDDEGKVKVADVLGARDTKRLEQKGPTGKAVAEFTAETAPAPVVEGGSGTSDKGEDRPADSSKGEERGGDGAKEGQAAGVAGNGTSGGSGGGSVDVPAGSSGIGQVASEATGISAGKLGLWLPLFLIAAAVWALAYFFRQRHRVA